MMTMMGRGCKGMWRGNVCFGEEDWAYVRHRVHPTLYCTVYSATNSSLLGHLRPSGSKVNSHSQFQDARKRIYPTLVIAPTYPAVRPSC
jgi:hypothetical protein